MLSKGLAKSVLVVDDDEAVLDSMKAVLELAGFDVKTVCDGTEVIKTMGNRRYDVLILDVNMPRIDGVELFQEIKNCEQYRGLPVVFTSGYPVWSEPEEGRREIFKKANAYLQKPFNIDVLMKTVERLAGK
ncbi:MAG: response regulator [Candidatus Abyssobacteria bacterium SURF_17]|uniref:Response regulator n=1 Tax=Candidatus Abyssobacteria bacterium SURF_17 TaxID=2093361 RepID=A0A419ERY0_9BACT|nr:MAG: response regulator [Candidatus Abyssubacteria bacterium SURF_17]